MKSPGPETQLFGRPPGLLNRGGSVACVAKGNKIIFYFVHLCPSTVLGLLFVHMALLGVPEPDVSTGLWVSAWLLGLYQAVIEI